MKCPNCNATEHEVGARFCHVCGATLIENSQSFHGSEPRLFLRKSNNLYGYVDQHGIVDVEPRFSDAHDFSEGLAAVKVGKSWGYINRQGEIIIRPRYNRACDFHESMAAVFDGHYWGFINIEGNLAVPCQYQDVGIFSEGVAPVCKNDKCGFINKEGQRVIDLQYNEAYEFKDGLARIRGGSSNSYGFINKNGKVVIKPSYEYARDFSEERTFVQCNEHSHSYYCYIDNKGNRNIYCKWDFADDYHDGLACIGVSNEYGFINKEGEIVIRPQFDDATYFSEEIAAIKIGQFWGYIDKNGRIIIAPQFLEAGAFQNGIAIVKDEDGYATIDKRGVKLSDNLSTPLPSSKREPLNREFVEYGIYLEEKQRVDHLKRIHHTILIAFAILASFVEFYTFKYFHGWGWAFVPFVVNVIFTVFRIGEVEDGYNNKFEKYEFALTFIPMALINIAAFVFTNGWSLAVLIPALLASIGVSLFVHDN